MCVESPSPATWWITRAVQELELCLPNCPRKARRSVSFQGGVENNVTQLRWPCVLAPMDKASLLGAALGYGALGAAVVSDGLGYWWHGMCLRSGSVLVSMPTNSSKPLHSSIELPVSTNPARPPCPPLTLTTVLKPYPPPPPHTHTR